MSRTRGYPTSRAYRGSSARAVTESLLNGIMALAFLACLVLLGLFVIGKLRKDREASSKEKTPAASKPRNGEGRPASGGRGTTRSPGSVQAAPGPSFDQLVADLNMAVIAREIARLRGESWTIAQKTNIAAVAHGNVISRSGGIALADKILEPQDQFLAVDDIVVTGSDPREAAERLTQAFQKVRAGSLHRFHVRRDSEERILFISFAVDASLPDARMALPARIPIPGDMAQEIQKKFWGLGSYYQETYFTPEERATVERCLSRSEATPDEFVFLTKRLLRDAAPEVEAEQSWFRTRIQALEAEMKKFQIPDAVVTRDGRRVDGRITEETGAHVKIAASYGNLTIYRNDVKEIHHAAEIRQEFDRRLNAAVQHPEAYPEFLAWARDWNLPVHREYIAYLMLLRDPADRVARLAAGYHQGEGGKWVLPEGGAPALRPEAALPATRKELQARLEELGFVLRDGKWFQKVAWSTGIHTLYQSSDVKWTGQGVAIMTARAGESALAVFTNTPISSLGPREMFLCPTGATGTVSISVTAPGEIVECKVKAAGAVVERDRLGRIEAALMPEGGNLVPLYTIDQMGNGEFIDVTEAVRGKRRFTVSVRMTTKVDKFHTYARFLPSLPDTRESFWVRGSVLQPAPEIDRSWAGAK